MVDAVAHVFHEPAGGGCGATYPDRRSSCQDGLVELVGLGYEIRRRVDVAAMAEQYLAVATLGSGHEYHHLMSCREPSQMVDTTCYLAAYGVVGAQCRAGVETALDLVDYAVEPFEALGGLRVQRDVAREVDAVEPVDILDHYGGAVGLSYETVYLGMTTLAVYHYLRTIGAVVCFFDALLQLQHYGTGGINDLDVVFARGAVCRRRLAMSTQKHLHVAQTAEIVMRDGLQSYRLQALYLAVVVHYIAQAIQRAGSGQLGLGLAYGGDHAETESRPIVYLDYRFHSAAMFDITRLN